VNVILFSFFKGTPSIGYLGNTQPGLSNFPY